MEDSVFVSTSSRLQLEASSALEAVSRGIESALVKQRPAERSGARKGLHSRTHSHASVSADECPVCSGSNSISGSHTHLADEPTARPRSALLTPLSVAVTGSGSQLSLSFASAPHSAGGVRGGVGASFKLLSSHVPIRAVSDALSASASVSSVDSLTDASAARTRGAHEEQRSPSGVHTVEEVNMATFRTPLEHMQMQVSPSAHAEETTTLEAAPLARIERQPYVTLESPRAPPVQLGLYRTAAPRGPLRPLGLFQSASFLVFAHAESDGAPNSGLDEQSDAMLDCSLINYKEPSPTKRSRWRRKRQRPASSLKTRSTLLVRTEKEEAAAAEAARLTLSLGEGERLLRMQTPGARVPALSVPPSEMLTALDPSHTVTRVGGGSAAKSDAGVGAGGEGAEAEIGEELLDQQMIGAPRRA